MTMPWWYSIICGAVGAYFALVVNAGREAFICDEYKGQFVNGVCVDKDLVTARLNREP